MNWKAPAFIAGGLLLGAGGLSARAEDSCVTCHSKATETATTAHTFQDWKDSSHGKAGIGCQTCHGGNPATGNQAAAHRGMLPSGHAKSAIYFTRIPETCGTCHAAEASAFKKSEHYAELKRTGRGPNCVTCHGSMADRVIDPREMENTCTLCHRKPTQAYAARMAVEEARSALQKLDGRLQRAKASGTIDLTAHKEIYRALLARFQALQVEWHSFDTVRVLSRAKDIARETGAAHTELALRDRKP